jgi:hypothetical protein
VLRLLDLGEVLEADRFWLGRTPRPLDFDAGLLVDWLRLAERAGLARVLAAPRLEPLLRERVGVPELDAFFLGSPLRLVLARSFSCRSSIESAMLREAPLRDDLLLAPRLADNAAPAAICCFFDFAGINK